MESNRRVINERHFPKDGLDYYATPAWVTNALLFNGASPGDKDMLVWEPAAGGGHMAAVLEKSYLEVMASDISPAADRVWGGDIRKFDFLVTDALFNDQKVLKYFLGAYREERAIITNPPFNRALEFALKALQLTGMVAILARLSWAEGVQRYERLFRPCPPDHVCVFTERIAYLKNGDPKYEDGAGTTANAWFVWDDPGREFDGERVTKWGVHNPMRRTQMRWIGPGKKGIYKCQ